MADEDGKHQRAPQVLERAERLEPGCNPGDTQRAVNLTTAGERSSALDIPPPNGAGAEPADAGAPGVDIYTIKDNEEGGDEVKSRGAGGDNDVEGRLGKRSRQGVRLGPQPETKTDGHGNNDAGQVEGWWMAAGDAFGAAGQAQAREGQRCA